MLGLRVVLLVWWCIAVVSGADRQKRSSWFFGPHYSLSHYYSGSHGYNSYHSKPACSPRRPCYDYVLLLTTDGRTKLTADANRLRDHYGDAGFDKAAVVAEGKHAAVFFLHQFGVNATGLHDHTYLAPDVKFPGDIRFGFKVESPPRSTRLTMAAKKDWTRFYNVPVRMAYWEMTFGKDFQSTGAVKGLIPAGGASRYGSFLIDTCPHQDGYQRCDPTLSTSTRGRLIVRFWNRGLHGVVVDDEVEHKDWGMGTGRGVQDPSVVHGRVVLTFPESCSPKDKCYPKGRRQMNKDWDSWT